MSFKNKELKPVDQVKITVQVKNGPDTVPKEYNALDPFWLCSHNYVGYQNTSSPEWEKVAKEYLLDLNRLLSMPFHEFWSCLMYDKGSVQMLESFLSNATPWFMLETLASKCDLYKQIFHKVFTIYDRILTFRETEEEYLVPAQAYKYIFEHEIISIPAILDFCQVYGRSNEKVVSEMVRGLIENIPEFPSELINTFSFVSEIMDDLVMCDSPTAQQLQDNIFLLLDMSSTLSIFLQMYPEASSIAHECNLHNHVLEFYEHSIPDFFEEMKTTDVPEMIGKLIDYSKVDFLSVISQILTCLLGNVIRLQDIEEEVSKWSNEYLTVLKSIVCHKLFLKDYQAKCSIMENLEILQQVYPKVNRVMVEEIEKSLDEETLARLSKAFSETIALGTAQEKPVAEHSTNSPKNDNADIRRQQTVLDVLEALPGLGEGFVEMCLSEMHYDSQKVISAVLDDDLPPSLACLDRSLPKLPPEEDKAEEIVALVNKNERPNDTMDLLADKTEIKLLKDRYMEYRLVDDIYDDEHDDRYDEPPIKLRDRFDDAGVSSEGESDQEPPKPSGAKDAFCEDPAIARAKFEARRQSRGGRRPPPADVVGRPRGQGQDKATERGRDKKNVHKATRANHNRRSGAQWKRSKGMIPS